MNRLWNENQNSLTLVQTAVDRFVAGEDLQLYIELGWVEVVVF
jgi:hypothetical protein